MPGSPKIAFLAAELHIPAAQSLKMKRRVLKSLKDRIRSRFNVSVAEIGLHEKWQRAVVGVCAIGNGQGHLDALLQEVLALMHSVHDLQVTHSEIEFL